MCPKKTPDAVATPEYVYCDNLSISVKRLDDLDNPDLCHYFGVLLREDKVIDHLHKYCSLCLQSQKMKR